MNQDRLASLPVDVAVQEAYRVPVAVQAIKDPDMRLVALLLPYVLLKDALGTRMGDALQAIDNMAHDSDRRLLPNVAAFAEFIRQEVL